MDDRTRAHHEPGEEPDATQEVPLARDLTTCVLDFVRDQVTPVAEWVAWTGGDPELVVLVIAETLRSIADGLEGETADDNDIPAPPTSSVDSPAERTDP